jgi:hypothetical protein
MGGSPAFRIESNSRQSASAGSMGIRCEWSQSVRFPQPLYAYPLPTWTFADEQLRPPTDEGGERPQAVEAGPSGHGRSGRLHFGGPSATLRTTGRPTKAPAACGQVRTSCGQVKLGIRYTGQVGQVGQTFSEVCYLQPRRPLGAKEAGMRGFAEARGIGNEWDGWNSPPLIPIPEWHPPSPSPQAQGAHRTLIGRSFRAKRDTGRSGRSGRSFPNIFASDPYPPTDAITRTTFVIRHGPQAVGLNPLIPGPSPRRTGEKGEDLLGMIPGVCSSTAAPSIQDYRVGPCFLAHRSAARLAPTGEWNAAPLRGLRTELNP